MSARLEIGDNRGTAGTIDLAGGQIAAANSNALGSPTTALNVTAAGQLSPVPGAVGTTILSRPITLGATLTLRGDTDLELSGVITNSGGDRTLAFNMNTASVATVSGTINLSEAATNRTLTLTNSTYNDTVVISGVIQNGGTSTASAMAKTGVGSIQLTNTNTYGGLTTVGSGVLQVSNANALGNGGTNEVQTVTVAATVTTFNLTFQGVTTGTITRATADGAAVQAALQAVLGAGSVSVSGVAGGPYTVTFTGKYQRADVATLGNNVLTGTGTITHATTTAGSGQTQINGGATLLLDNGITLSEAVTLNGNAQGFQVNRGAVYVASGTATLSGAIIGFTDNTDAALGVADGATLIIDAPITRQNNNGIIKVGKGVLSLGGDSDNSFNRDLVVREGLVLLNKTAGRNAAGGGVTVGDGTGAGGATPAILRWMASDQIPVGTITVNPAGSANLNGFSDAVGGLTLQRLGSYAGEITGTGTLTLGGDITVNNIGHTDTNTAAATISVTTLALGASRTFTVNDSLRLGSGDDLVISSVITGAGFNLTKSGFGTLALTANNTYSGTTTINTGTFVDGVTRYGGSLILRGDGDIAQSTGITVNAGASLVLDNSLGLASDAAGRIGNVDVALAGGNLVHIGHSTLAVTESILSLTINAPADTGGGGSSMIRSVHSGGNLTLSTTAATGLVRGAGASARFIAEGADLGQNGGVVHQVLFGGTIPGVSNNTLTWAVLDQASTSDLEFVTNGANGIDDAAFVTDLNTATATDNVKVSASVALASTGTVNALMITGAAAAITGAALTVASGLVINEGGPGLNSIANALTLSGAETIVLVEAATRLAISGAVTSTGSNRKEGNGTLTLSGNNTGLTGTINVADGRLIVANAGALGATASGTTVSALAALDIDATSGTLNFGNEAITLNGTGIDNDNAGALRLTAGNAIIGTGATALTLGQATVITVASASTLDVNANVTGNQNLTKQGAGVLEFSGGTTNASTGARIVNEGTLRLNKTGALLAVQGAVTVGNFTGTALVQYGSLAGTNQILDTAAVTVNDKGVFDLATNNKSDLVASLTMTGGEVKTGTGTLTLNGNITYTAGGEAVINGLLNLNNGTRTITVADGKGLNDLTINAALSNGRLVKAGAGLLALNNSANTFTADVNEVQRIVTAATVAGTSTFNITFNGSTTATITVGANDAATATNIQNALQALPGIGATGVTVSVAAASTFNLNFAGHLGGVDLPNQITTTVVAGAGTYTPSTLTAGVVGVRLNAGALSLGNNSALGSARLHIDGSSQLLASGGDRTLTNNVTINPNINVTFGGRRDYDGTNDLTLSGGVTLVGAAAAQVVNLDVTDTQTLVTMSGVISGGGDLLVPVKRGIGTLVWSGNNTFDVRNFTAAADFDDSDGIRIEGGILRVSHSNALGSAAQSAALMIRGDLGAVLEIDGTTVNGSVNITGKVLDVQAADVNSTTIMGTRGFLNRTSTEAVHTGTIRNLGGTNSITSPNNEIRLRNISNNTQGSTFTFGSDAGRLDLNGGLSGYQNNATPTAVAARGLYKTGAGAIRTSGTTANNITGGYYILGGALELNKTAGVNAIDGNIIIGDAFGGPNADRLVILASNQIADTRTVTINPSGQMSLAAGVSELATVSTLVAGDTSRGSANIDLAATSSLRLNADVAVTHRTGGSGTSAGTSITGGGTLELVNAAGTRTFTVADGPSENDLLVSAVVANGGGTGNLTKAGAGRMTLSGANTFGGTVSATAGVVRAASNGALGTGTGVNEVQTLSALTAPATTFTLSFGGIASGTITVGATDALTMASIQAALDGVVGAGNTLVANPVAGQFSITFQGNLANFDVGQLTLPTGSTIVNTATTAGQGGVVVSSGAALELDSNITITGETVGLQGSGITNGGITAVTTSLANTGALRSISGNNTWSGSVILNGANGENAGIGVEAGTLTVNGNIFQQLASIGLIKGGTGTLEMTGAQENAFGGSTFVNQGTLLLNKAGASRALRGTLHVGDNRGGADADVVRYASTAGTNQIGDVTVVIHSTGLLDMNGISDTVNTGTLTLIVGPDSSGELRTGGGGTFGTNTGVAALVMANTTGSSPAAVISGGLNLGAGERSFDIRRSGGMTYELDVQAAVTSGGITKVSMGALRLSSGGNNYAGVTSVLGGKLIVGANGALGGTASGTLVSEGASLIFPGGVTYTGGETISIVGRGFNGEGAIQNFGTNSFAGNIQGYEGRYDTTALIRSNTGTLTVSGAVTLRDVQLEVDGAGDIALIGGVRGTTAADAAINGFEQRFFDLPQGGIANNLADVLATSHQVRNVFTGPLAFVDDASINTAAETDINGLASSFAAVWTTTFTPNESGVWQFQTNGSVDDVAAVWIDLDGNGTFEPTELIGVRGNVGAFGPFSTPALVSGRSYLMAVALSDNSGGGALPDFQYRAPSAPFGTFTSLNTSNVGQNGLWTVQVEREGVIKNGNGKLTLGSSGTYAGATTVNAGTLELTNTFGSATGTGTVSVASAASLTGTGASSGTVTVASGGTVSPGVAGVGTLAVGNFVHDGAFVAQVNGTLTGEFDRVRVTGTVDLTGSTLTVTGSVTAAYGAVTLIENDGTADAVTGTFTGLAEGATVTVNGVDFTISYIGGDGNDVVLAPVAPVAIPPGLGSGSSGYTPTAAPVTANTNTITLTWDGGGDGVSWADPLNWAGDVAPVEGNDLLFTGTGTVTNNNFAAGTRFNTIVINGSGFTLGGNAVRLSGGLTTNHVSGTNTVDVDLTLVNAQTIMNANPGATLLITGDIRTGALVGTTNIFGTSALTVDGYGTTTVSGVIDGQGSLYKIGAGTLTLSAANTYEGFTDVRQGVLVAAHNNALGNVTTGNVQIQAGASLHLTGGVTIANALAIREGGIGFGEGADPSSLGALRSISGNNTWSGNIDLSNANVIVGVNAGSTLNFSGVVAQGLSRVERIVKVGAGTLQFTGTQSNLIFGDVRVLQGTLELGKTGGAVAFQGNLLVGTDIEATGTATVKLLGNSQFRILNTFENGLNTVTVLSTGLLDLNGFNQSVGNIVLNTGVTNSGDIVLGGGTLTLGGASLTVNGFQGSSGLSPAATITGGTLDLGTFYSGAGGGITKTFTINDTQLGNVATDLTVSANIVGAADISVSKTGGGTLRLSGNNSGLTGPFLMNGGIIEVGHDSAFGTGLVSLQNDGNVLRAVGGSRTIANTISLDGNLATIGSDNLTFNGNITLTADRALLTMDPAQTVTINGVIDEGFYGNRTFTKIGRGTLVLTAASTYSGSTVLADDGGVTILKDGATLLNPHTIVVRDGATLKLDNTGTANLSNRINDRTQFQLEGGDLHLVAGTGGIVQVKGGLPKNFPSRFHRFAAHRLLP